MSSHCGPLSLQSPAVFLLWSCAVGSGVSGCVDRGPLFSSLSAAGVGFILVIDRRQDRWAAVKGTLLRIAVSNRASVCVWLYKGESVFCVYASVCVKYMSLIMCCVEHQFCEASSLHCQPEARGGLADKRCQNNPSSSQSSTSVPQSRD